MYTLLSLVLLGAFLNVDAYSIYSFRSPRYNIEYSVGPNDVSVQTSFGRIATSPRAIPPPSTCTSAFCQRFGFNLGEYARFEWDRQRPKILALAENPKTSDFIQEMVDVNPCVDSLDAYDTLIEIGARFLEANAETLENSYMSILSLKGEKDMVTLFTKYAKMYTELDGVWSQLLQLRCQADGQTFVKAVRDLAFVLDKMSKVKISLDFRMTM